MKFQREMFRERKSSIIHKTNCENCGYALKVEYSWDEESKSFIPTEFYDRYDLYCGVALEKCPECGEILEM